jgi:outer membrane biogenesis lipoprotein LolB
MKQLNSMLRRSPRSIYRRAILVLLAPILLAACAAERPDMSAEPYEPSFQEKVAECSKIADRGERNRCLYGG